MNMKGTQEMTIVSNMLLVMAIGICSAATACKSENKTEEKQQTLVSKEMPRRPAEVQRQKPVSFVQNIMKPYEECRALLAADTTDGIGSCSKAITDAANAAHPSAPAAAKDHLTELAKASEALSAGPADDIEKLRIRFGDVSKSLITLLTAVPTAAKDIHVFECPMAKGYKRWAQSSAKMGNPYMGTQMLECGSEVHDHHQMTTSEHDGKHDR